MACDLKVDLKGQVAFVTGGGKGLGRAIAISLAENGADVVVISRTQADTAETAVQIMHTGASCLALNADVRNVSEITAVVEEAFAWRGRLDILVNSAGINIPQPCLEVTEEDWDRIIDTNMKGTFFCCQAVGKKMSSANYGKIINITSQMAFVGYYNRAAYAASKGGVTQLSKVLAVELAPFNVNVNCVAPTFLETPFTSTMFSNKEFYEDVISRIPLKRIGQADDVVGAVLYLASNAANLVTGSTVTVDGGWTAW